MPSPISNAAAQIAATGAAAIRKPVQEAHDSHLKHRVRGEAGSPGRSSKRGSMSEYGLKGGRADIGQPDGDLRDDLAGISLDDPAANGTEETGDAVIAAAREHNADVSALLGGKDGLGHPVAADGTIDREHDFSLEHQPTGQLRLETDGVARDARTQRLSSAPEDTGALMLDMSGYKVEDEKDEMRAKSKRAEQELEGDVSRMGIDESACCAGLAATLQGALLTSRIFTNRGREGDCRLHAGPPAVDRPDDPAQLL